MKKIEHKTVYSIPYGEICLYETNTPFKGLDFNFDNPSVSMMLQGEKKIKWNDESFDFGTRKILIPEKKQILTVDVDYASFDNPLKCAILTIDESFVSSFYDEITSIQNKDWIDVIGGDENEILNYFVSEEGLLINSFFNLLNDRTSLKEKMHQLDYIFQLKMKELTYLILQSKARKIILNQKLSENNPLYDVINYINNNFKSKIKIEELAKIACMSESKLFAKFKENFGCSPNHFIIQKRLEYAHELLSSNIQNLTISEISYMSGFNNVEHFNRKFKEVFSQTPSKIKK
ncbi:helix-turn-helix domain-containing protein [Faecalibacter bovis]|uniref:Helix-turn-helix domain-containing protein n=1 Tax=Faecalibacter bovis TaxID=2898187 RepID=A0ABX7XAD0_9FLAO|nr:helix-turn-helix domain-containing protein [Faecalibacter bovis]QTV04866.1 helix-turn-helix domain-containing protein [Faecalibacter bovis]